MLEFNEVGFGTMLRCGKVGQIKRAFPQSLLCISTSEGGGGLREGLDFPDEDGEIVAKGEIQNIQHASKFVFGFVMHKRWNRYA